jgi:uncharacterized protein YegP (UPF0339 family)
MLVEFEEHPDQQLCICRCPAKMVGAYTIRKDNSGYIFFEIVADNGSIPADLKGKYSSLDKAKKAVVAYLRDKKETVAARRENFAKERAERKALKDAPKSIPEGS